MLCKLCCNLHIKMRPKYKEIPVKAWAESEPAEDVAWVGIIGIGVTGAEPEEVSGIVDEGIGGSIERGEGLVGLVAEAVKASYLQNIFS